MRIVGYQFSHLETLEYDSKWLIIARQLQGKTELVIAALIGYCRVKRTQNVAVLAEVVACQRQLRFRTR